MSSTLPTDESAELLAERLHAARDDIAASWLDRLHALLPVDRYEVFPSVSLLDHIPQLISAVADYLKAPHTEEISANTAVMTKAAELGTLRYEQRASVHQLLREYQILGDLLEEFFLREVETAGVAIDALSALAAMRRVMQAVRVLQQQTVDTFVTKYTETIDRQTTELRGFTRLVSHEIRQPLGVLQVIAKMWPTSEHAQERRLAEALNRNVARLGEVADKLERLARLSRAREDTPTEQYLDLVGLVTSVAEQLQDMADTRGVTIRVSPTLPGLVVDAARVELVFINLIANAIKYADPDKTERVIEIETADEQGGSTLAVVVRDNGIGIPANRLDVIFQQFVRVHSDRDQELGAQGLGLGLSIVRECMDATGGAVSVTSREQEGTTFTLAWPDRSAGV
jgi:signal transduction histidine kinase